MIQANTEQVLITEQFNAQPDAVVWFRPVFPDGRKDGPVIDFEVEYCNNKAAEMLATTVASVKGARLLRTPLLDPNTRERIFQQCLQVMHTGNSIEFNYRNPARDRYYNVQRSLIAGGILNVTRDRTDEVHAEIDRKEREEYFRQILDSAADSILVLESIRDAGGTITDFQIAHCNRKCYEIARFPPDVIGRTLLEALPHLLDSDQLEWHKEVADTGKSMRFETSFRDDSGREYGWFIVSLTRLRDGVISTFVDVTDRRQAERRIEEQKFLLDNIFASALSGMFAAKAVRDHEEHIIDFLIQKINPAFTRLVGQTEAQVIGHLS
ncbi:MAG: PAS domain-containing protein, partial [Chitinophagaceae bacterium]